jgi:hypothetical protein
MPQACRSACPVLQHPVGVDNEPPSQYRRYSGRGYRGKDLPWRHNRKRISIGNGVHGAWMNGQIWKHDAIDASRWIVRMEFAPGQRTDELQ